MVCLVIERMKFSLYCIHFSVDHFVVDIQGACAKSLSHSSSSLLAVFRHRKSAIGIQTSMIMNLVHFYHLCLLFLTCAIFYLLEQGLLFRLYYSYASYWDERTVTHEQDDSSSELSHESW